MHYGILSAPLLKLVKFDSLDIFFYKYETFELLSIYVNHYLCKKSQKNLVCFENTKMQKAINNHLFNKNMFYYYQ